MKINTATKLGQRLVSRGNEERMTRAMSKRFAMTQKDMTENKIKVKIVVDKIGLIMAVQALGDEIAPTIRTGMNICALDMKQFVNEDGVLGENATDLALMYSGLYWKVWDKETKELNMSLAQEIVDSRRGASIEAIYENEDITIANNKFGMTRYIYGVNDYYLRRAELALAAINADTTLAELERLQRDFVFLTRGLGEQTIDITKHVDYVFYTTMKRLISPHISVVGGIKELESNVAVYRRTKEQYTIVPKDNGRNVNYRIDSIGHLKQAAVDTMEESMRSFIKILEKECNYDSYKQYEDIDLSKENYFLLACCIDAAGDAAINMNNEERERTVAGLYNIATDMGITQEDVFKIAMKVVVSEPRNNRLGQTVFVPLIGTNKEYKIDMYRMAILFGDVFVAQYKGQDIIEVPVDYETEIDIEEGTEIEITNGYGYGGMLHVLSVFQNGTVRVKDNELVALYNPLQTILDRYPNATVLPVESYAKELCRFNSWIPASVEDLEKPEEEQPIGFKQARNSVALRALYNNVADEYCIAAIAKDNSMTAAAKIKQCYKNTSSDFILHNTICFKSLILADQSSIR